MLDERHRKRFEAQVRAAEERSRQNEEQRAARSTALPQAGDLYVFPLERSLALQWAIIDSHPDDSSLLFTVPADDAPWVGTADLATRAGLPAAPLILRCGCGLWLRDQQFPPELRVASLNEQDRQQARRLLARLVRGTLIGTCVQAETDADPAYEVWMDKVLEAVELLRTRLRIGHEGDAVFADPAKVIRLDQFERGWPSTLASLPDREAELALVAASAGLLGQVVRQLAASPAKPPWQYRLDDDLEGDLYAFAEPAGVRLVYLPRGREMPPLLQYLVESGQSLQITWRPSPRGTLYMGFPTVPWLGEYLQFGQPDGPRWVIYRTEERAG